MVRYAQRTPVLSLSKHHHERGIPVLLLLRGLVAWVLLRLPVTGIISSPVSTAGEA